MYKSNFVTFDYEGCGMSSGKPSEEAVVRAAETIYAQGAKFSQIIVWGRSIGSIAATHLGAKYQLPTIIQSGLASAYHVAFENVRTNLAN